MDNRDTIAKIQKTILQPFVCLLAKSYAETKTTISNRILATPVSIPPTELLTFKASKTILMIHAIAFKSIAANANIPKYPVLPFLAINLPPNKFVLIIAQKKPVVKSGSF